MKTRTKLFVLEISIAGVVLAFSTIGGILNRPNAAIYFTIAGVWMGWAVFRYNKGGQ